MPNKTPVVLIVFVNTSERRWHVAGLTLEGAIVPLLRSEPGNLDYLDRDFDDQVTFLRHRLCGVLQRGCDRLWARQLKPKQFVFLFDGNLDHTRGELTSRVAQHFVDWLSNPPAAVFRLAPATDADSNPMEHLAGTLEAPLQELVQTSVAPLTSEVANDEVWEVERKKA